MELPTKLARLRSPHSEPHPARMRKAYLLLPGSFLLGLLALSTLRGQPPAAPFPEKPIIVKPAIDPAVPTKPVTDTPIPDKPIIVKPKEEGNVPLQPVLSQPALRPGEPTTAPAPGEPRPHRG